MLPLSVLLALTSAHADDRRVSVLGFQGALNAMQANDVLVLDVPGGVTNEVAERLDMNFTFEISADAGSGIGPGAQLRIGADNAGNQDVTINNVSFSGPGPALDPTNLNPLPEDTGPGLVITGKDAVLNGVRFSGYQGGFNGDFTGSAFSWFGQDNNLIVIDGADVENNTGPAMLLTGGDAEIYSSEFQNNGNEYAVGGNVFFFREQYDFRGAGLHFDGGNIILGAAEVSNRADPNPVITRRGNEFSNNLAVSGGGAYVRAQSGKIEANDFTDNIANDMNRYSEAAEANGVGFAVGFNGTGLGGGLLVEDSGTDSTLEVRWNEFTNNWGWEVGGVHFENTDDLLFENNLVAQNWALKYGGGLSLKQTDANDTPRPVVRNNTLVGNVAGITRVLFTIQVVGGGGNARFEGVIPEFRNNVVSHAVYGGGILGVVEDGPFDPGDDFSTYFRYNVMYDNCEIVSCQPGAQGDTPFTGNYQQYAAHPTNIMDVEPDYIYFGDLEEDSILSDDDAYPDVFCLEFDSVGIGAGDPDLPNLNDSSYESDVGHCGGVECLFFNLDRDEDGWLQHQDCLDDPDVIFPDRPLPEDVNPDAEEICDYEDNNCNGLVDESFENKWWPDNDGDGGGDAGDVGVLACLASEVPAGYVSNNDDCDDENPDKNGSIAERCDSYDNDCDGFINEEEDLQVILGYVDADLDGYGAQGAQPELVCESIIAGEALYWLVTPEGEPEDFLYAGIPAEPYDYFAVGDDCNDSSPEFNPMAVELCDAADQNCNGDGYDVPDGANYYLDLDGDGWGDVTTRIALCEGQPIPDGYVVNGGDCDETNALVNNGADETCDAIDNDCNSIVDDDPVDGQLRYEDFDNDGFGNPATALRACAGAHGPTFTASVGGDCDDNDASVGECSECGCQAAPTTGSVGFLGIGLMAVLGLRRRR